MADTLKQILLNIFTPFGKEYQDVINGVALGLLCVTWVFIIGTTIERIRVYDPVILVRILTLIVVTIGVYVAVWKLVADQRWRRSEVYLEQAKELLEKAFNALEVDSSTGYPINSRQRWLSSSRLLLSALALGERISEPSQKETLNEYLEYWRIQFRELLDFEGERSPDEHYFYEPGSLHSWSPRVRAPIAECSIAVLYRFMQWPDGVEDRLESENNFSLNEIERMERFGAQGIAAYCRQRNRT